MITIDDHERLSVCLLVSCGFTRLRCANSNEQINVLLGVKTDFFAVAGEKIRLDFVTRIAAWCIFLWSTHLPVCLFVYSRCLRALSQRAHHAVT